MISKRHFKTLVVSDVHLGSKNSKTKELVRFLKANSCEKLILNGDIVDGWQLKRSGKWKKKHTRFFKAIIKMIEKYNTEVVYIRGNHDDFLDNVMPFSIGKLSIQKDYIHESFGKRYYVLHGDIFDTITTNFSWLAKLGDIGYSFLLWLNKTYNNRRLKKGLPYFSLSSFIKQKVKRAVSYISSFEEELVKLARHKHCHGVICGHIHHPAIEHCQGVEYLNSGDWVESFTALAEDFQGRWRVIYYSDLLEEEKRNENLAGKEVKKKEKELVETVV